MSNQTLMVLGRQPAIALAELMSLYGSSALRPLGKSCALLDLPASEVDSKRLGGTIKTARLLTTLDTTDWKSITKWLLQTAPHHLQYVPEGKLQLGLSTIGLNVHPKQILATGLELKKEFRGHGRSVRLIPNQQTQLSSAQVLHNRLTGPLGWELVFVSDGQQTYVAQTTYEQDIEAYAARDQQRPKRDARVGMLPPKLAQIIINLASGQVEAKSKTQNAKKLLDPFCGTGVLLQEALLLGYQVIGTDLEPRMIEYSQANLDWLSQKYSFVSGRYGNLAIGDATSYSWPTFDLIACETYLGRPFSAEPKPDVLDGVVRDVDTIHRKFLKNVARQTQSGFRMCIAVPAWKTKNGFKHLKVLDSLGELGYTRVSFVHAGDSEMIYHRPGQIVARELVTLIRK